MKNERLAEVEKLFCALIDKDILPLIQKVLHKRARLYVAAAEDISKEIEGGEVQQDLPQARELLAVEFGRVGWHQAASDARRGDLDGTPTLRAIIAALRANVQPDWKIAARDWLLDRAAEQVANNVQWPRHAEAYQRWRDLPEFARQFAKEIESGKVPIPSFARKAP